MSDAHRIASRSAKGRQAIGGEDRANDARSRVTAASAVDSAG
jgi:hypothetical protein